eukprot:scaffold425_cov365-Pavlova_lutheri.AAC.10
MRIEGTVFLVNVNRTQDILLKCVLLDSTRPPREIPKYLQPPPEDVSNFVTDFPFTRIKKRRPKNHTSPLWKKLTHEVSSTLAGGCNTTTLGFGLSKKTDALGCIQVLLVVICVATNRKVLHQTGGVDVVALPHPLYWSRATCDRLAELVQPWTTHTIGRRNKP